MPIVPNEFGVCMVYGRCCTMYDGARQAWVSRHFCPVGDFWSPEFLCVFSVFADFLPFRKRQGRKAVPFLNSGIPFLHFLWPSWKYMECFLSSRGPFMSLYYIYIPWNWKMWTFFMNIFRERILEATVRSLSIAVPSMIDDGRHEITNVLSLALSFQGFVSPSLKWQLDVKASLKWSSFL